MKKCILMIGVLFTCVASTMLAQDNQVIKISADRKENIVDIYAENIDPNAYEVEINIASTGFKHTRQYPIKLTLQPGEKLLATSLIAKKDEAANYSVTMTYTRTHPDHGSKNRALAAEISNADVSKGVSIFMKNGCGRCSHVEKFLTDNKVKYQSFNISKSANDASLMWKLLSDDGYQEKTVSTPVFLVDGKMYYNLDDYNSLLKSLASTHFK